MKSGFISVVGRTNAGKSTLVNKLVGEKVSIVSDKPQTTRYRIMGVLNDPDYQIVFTDTPGLHRPKTRLGDFMVNQATESIADTDGVILVVEPVNHVGESEQKILSALEKTGAPVILVINKIDTIKRENLLAIISTYSQAFSFHAVVPVSARTGSGLPLLLSELMPLLVDGPLFFPQDMVTDSPLKQRIAEIVREKLLWALEKEVPHGIAIEINILEEEEEINRMDIIIYCEKPSHKGIIIGKNGELLKKVGTQARRDIETLIGKKAFVQLWVKVKEGWRDNNYLLKNFGFTNQ